MPPFDGAPRAGEHRPMADDAKPGETEEQHAATRAIADWSKRVAGASGVVWGETFSHLSELEQRIVTVIHNAAITLQLAREGLADERDRVWLERLATAKDDRPATLKLALAAQIVAECAEKSTPALRHGPAEFVNWGQLCKGLLASDLDPAFEKLKVTDVDALLARYTNTKDRQGGKLTPAGILVELNKLADHPLGRDFNAKRVTDAVGRNQR